MTEMTSATKDKRKITGRHVLLMLGAFFWRYHHRQCYFYYTGGA